MSTKKEENMKVARFNPFKQTLDLIYVSERLLNFFSVFLILRNIQISGNQLQVGLVADDCRTIGLHTQVHSIDKIVK